MTADESSSRTNLDRALDARDFVAFALNQSRYMALEDYDSGLVEALASLMHFARRYGVDFELALGEARHFAQRDSSWAAPAE